MNLKLKNTIEDYNDHSYWGIKQSISDGFIGYSPNSNKLKIVNSVDFAKIVEVEYPSNLMFQFRNNILKYVLNNNEVYSLDLATEKVSKIYSTADDKKAYIAFLNDSYIMVDIRLREKRKVISKSLQIIDLNNSEVKVKYEDEFEFLKLIDDSGLFYHPISHQLEIRSITDKKTLWQTRLDGEPWIDNAIYDSNSLYLPVNSSSLGYYLHKIDLITGKILWSITNVTTTSHLYKKSIVQISGIELNVYDLNSGVAKNNIELKELTENNINISSNLTDIEGDLLYFTSYIRTGKKKKTVLGIIDLTTYKLDLLEVPFEPSKVDMRSPIGRPFVNNKNVYIEFGKTLKKYTIE